MGKVVGVTPPAPGKAIRVQMDGRAIAVFNLGGELRALDAKCTHVGGPLDQGPVGGGAVTCPWHGSKFDLASGAVLQGPAIKPVRSYSVRVEPDGLTLDPR